MLKVFF